MKDKISKYITTRPYLLQIAKDGNWEKVWCFAPTDHVSGDDIKKYLNSKLFKTVAIEAVFKEENDQMFILGLDFNEHSQAINTLEFLQIVIKESSDYQSFGQHIQNLDKRLMSKAYMFKNEPDLIRIGVVNHWFSVGPCLLWKKGMPKEMDDNILNARLEAKPAVVRTDLNYQGMSFIFNKDEKAPGFTHWMKSPCSRYDGSTWELDHHMILKYLHEWQGFELK